MSYFANDWGKPRAKYVHLETLRQSQRNSINLFFFKYSFYCLEKIHWFYCNHNSRFYFYVVLCSLIFKLCFRIFISHKIFCRYRKDFFLFRKFWNKNLIFFNEKLRIPFDYCGVNKLRSWSFRKDDDTNLFGFWETNNERTQKKTTTAWCLKLRRDSRLCVCVWESVVGGQKHVLPNSSTTRSVLYWSGEKRKRN